MTNQEAVDRAIKDLEDIGEDFNNAFGCKQQIDLVIAEVRRLRAALDETQKAVRMWGNKADKAEAEVAELRDELSDCEFSKPGETHKHPEVNNMVVVCTSCYNAQADGKRKAEAEAVDLKEKLAREEGRRIEAEDQVAELRRQMEVPEVPCPHKSGVTHRANSCVFCERDAAIRELSELRGKLERLKEFNACMEAQRKDLELPPGHDDPDMACNDGTCFQVGRLIEEALASRGEGIGNG